MSISVWVLIEISLSYNFLFNVIEYSFKNKIRFCLIGYFFESDFILMILK